MLEIRGCPAFLLVCFLRFEGCVLRVFLARPGSHFILVSGLRPTSGGGGRFPFSSGVSAVLDA